MNAPEYISPIPSNIDIVKLPPPPVAGGIAASLIHNITPDIFVADVPSTALYDTTVNPLVVSPTVPGLTFYVTNNEPVPILVMGTISGDPGVVVSPGSSVLLGFSTATTGSGAGFTIAIGGGVPGGTGSGTYSVATLALRPVVASVPNGTWVYVISQKSWYWTDLVANTYMRLIVPNDFWMTQASWGLDTAAGNDENLGTIASPLRTLAEFQARLPRFRLDTTLQVAAGSVITALDWDSLFITPLSGGQATPPYLSIIGVRTLGADVATVGSSDETGNTLPNIDLGIALTPGTMLQVTSGPRNGATAPILSLFVGTVYTTAPWRNAAGARVAPPGAGDTVAIVTMPSIPLVGQSAPATILFLQNFAINSIASSIGRNFIFRTSTLAGSYIPNGLPNIVIDGCAVNFTLFQFKGTNLIALLSAFRNAATNLYIDTASAGAFSNCVLQEGISIIVLNGGYLEVNSFGVVQTAGGINVLHGGTMRVRGTLYGTANTAGVIVQLGGKVRVDTGLIPTMAVSAGQELTLESGATAIPPLAAGAAVPAASAFTTWAQWNAAPFSRYAMSYSTGAAIYGD